MPSSKANWVENQTTNVIDYDAARASRERQERVAEEKKARRRRQREAERLSIDLRLARKAKKLVKRIKRLEFQASKEWKGLRYKALKRDGGKCQCCGRAAKDGVKMHVDHIKPKSKYPELALRLDNLQVLCADCNEGKAARDETDWRPPVIPR